MAYEVVTSELSLDIDGQISVVMGDQTTMGEFDTEEDAMVLITELTEQHGLEESMGFWRKPGCSRYYWVEHYAS